jgi:DNA-directed RNA polymerase subunit D
MKLDKKHENRIEFVAEVSTSFANLVRRYAIGRIPVLAIDQVTFYDNSSPLWDEYISHRLGLMPVITPDKTPESAEIVFSLDAEGPKVVYSSEMKSSDPDIAMAKNIPIVTLGPNQHLRFEAKAVLGIARKHAKFQSSIVSYGKEGDALHFMVESCYQMEPVEVIERACDVITDDIEIVEEALGKKSAKRTKKRLDDEKKAKKEKKAEEARESAAKEEADAAAEEKKEAKEEKAEKKAKKEKKEKEE